MDEKTELAHRLYVAWFEAGSLRWVQPDPWDRMPKWQQTQWLSVVDTFHTARESDPHTGLPIHLPMAVDASGNGPACRCVAVVVRCWCPEGDLCSDPRGREPLERAVVSCDHQQQDFDPADVYHVEPS